ncbi:hypothetical protein GCM10009850_039470 [Nonomuraea monospora]|uniref:Uncharacterized protein n=1 Tax=Nonomuraea monospora TaxID=568818 RepID=A0ABP5P9Z0_9ACTN
MSYDLYFYRRDPGQSWDDALTAAASALQPDPTAWDGVVTGVRDLLGEVNIVAYPPNWELDHDGTGICVNHWEGGWEMSVPYRTHGEAARQVVGLLYEVASVVERESGFECFDPQLGLPKAQVTDPGAAVPTFDAVAGQYGRRDAARA